MRMGDEPEDEYDGASQHARLLALGAALGSALQGGAPCSVLPGMSSGGTAASTPNGQSSGTPAPEVARMSSKFVGVHRSGKKRKPWTAACYWNGKQHHLGYFKTEEEAAQIYDDFVRERALDRRLNFPTETEDKMSAADAKASSKSTRGIASRFAGVHHSRSNPQRPWRASCMSKRKYHHLGIYQTEEEAALAYDAFVIENNLGRELNFPQYRHMLQLGAAGAQSLGAIAHHITPGGVPAQGQPGMGMQVEALKATAGGNSFFPGHATPLPGAVSTNPSHPSFAALMGGGQGMPVAAAQHHGQRPVAGYGQPQPQAYMVHPHAQAQAGYSGQHQHWATAQPQVGYAQQAPQVFGQHQAPLPQAQGRYVWMSDQ